MFLIFSSQQDYCTQKVVEWLYNMNKRPIVINELNPIIGISFSLENNRKNNKIVFTTSCQKIISDKEIDIIWYRIGSNFFKFPYIKRVKKRHLFPFYQNLKSEYVILSQFFFDQFRSCLKIVI